MTIINGYKIIEQLYKGKHSSVFRAIRNKDNKRIILKILTDEFPTDNDINKYRREFKIGKEFSDTHIVQYFDIEPYNHGLAIIEEDYGAVSLKEIIPTNEFSPTMFLRIAIQMAEGVDVIHRKNIVHRVINPHHIVINTETNIIKFIDFGVSSPLDQEIQLAVSPGTLGINLAYISPEQTGRMNRIIDYRTDFYSLGVTFYELLTGCLPFNEKDALALIHSHIAKIPLSPKEIKSDIPSSISGIVMKLLAKNAEDRYQTAFGLKMDLEECLMQLENKEKIENFFAGQNDLSDRFQIQQKLYGRDREIEQLLNAFDQVGEGRVRSTLMLVYGYSGIGKSSLINEVHKSLVRERGYFISGKYDQFKRNIPYSSFIQAFQGLIKQLLTESEENVARWKTEILQALGDNAQVIVDVIPEVEMIIGPQPSVPILDAVENQNRFNRVLQNFCSVFSQKEHPLVIFLDDLQWADLPTLNLMKRMITNPDFRYLFFIGAFRDNEVDTSHPLTGVLSDIQKKISIKKVSLKPLNLIHVNCIVADSTNCTKNQSKPLAELVHNKTLGNPFFVNMFLKMLYQEKLIKFDFKQRGWTWDLQKIEAMDITGNVVDLMVTRIRKLSPDSQYILSLASCIGNQFDLKMLSLIYGASVIDTYGKFWSVVTQGLIMPVEVEYKWVEYINDDERQNAKFRFLHDRVQQAAYSLIAEVDRSKLHLRIGRLLLNNMRQDELEENIFEVVNHLNQGRSLISDNMEKDQVARLNLRAATKAKLSSAYEPALNYVSVGMEYLPEDSWEKIYDLTLSYYLEKGEIEYLNSYWDKAIATFDEALQHAGSLLDRCTINEYKSTLYRMKNDLKKSLNVAVQALGELGIHVSAFPDEAETMKEVEQARNMVADKDIESLFNLSELNDPESLAAMKLLRECFAPAYFLGSRLTSIIGIRMTEITIKHGNCSHSAAGYIFFSAITLAADLGDFDDAYKFGSLALRLNDQKYHEKAYEALILDMWGTFVCHYKEPINIARDHLMRGYYSGVENGSYQWAGYCAMINLFMTFWGDNTLNEVSEKIEKVLPGLEKIDPNMAQYYYAVNATVFNLKEPVEKKTVLHETVWPDMNEVLKASQEQNDMLTLLVVTTCRLSLANWYFDYKKAIEYAETGEKYANGSPGVFINPVFQFHQCLAYSSAYEYVDEQKRSKFLEKIKTNISKLEHMAVHSPTTYLHQAQLVKAELARIEGSAQEAMGLYDQAIESAQVNGFIQNEALANEMAARFWLSMGKRQIAGGYFREASFGYKRWGAGQKVDDLEKKYSNLLRPHQIRDSGITTDDISITANNGPKGIDALDLTSVIRTSQAISSEIDLKKLLSKIMEIIIENAGAQKGFLIHKKNDQLHIEAAVNSDSDEIKVLQPIPIDGNHYLSEAIVRYVARTGENVILHNAAREGMFVENSYITENQSKSILCMPIRHKNKISGILYLENNLVSSSFTRDRIELLHILLVQAAISLENARLYTELKQEISERKRAEEAILRRARVASLGADIGTALTKTNTLRVMLDGCAEAFVKHLDVAFARIWTLNKKNDMLELQASAGIYTRIDGAYSRVPVGKLKIGQIAKEHKPKLTNDVMNDPRINNKEWVKQEGMVAFAGYPLVVEGRSIGVMAMFARQSLTVEIIDALGSVADSIALGIERKLAEAQIRKLSRVVEQSPNIIVITDTRGNIEYANPKYTQVTGYSLEETLGQNPRILKSCQTPQETYGQLWKTITSGQEWRGEFCNRKKNGELFWESAYILPIKNDEGDIIHFVAIKEDITERRKMEKELIKVQKLESVGVLAGGIAHDFNNSLQAILGYITLAELHESPNNGNREYLKEAKKAVLQSRGLTQQLLTFSKGGEPVKNTLSISELLRDSVRLALSGSSHRCDYDIPDDLWQVEADKGQMNQVISNLIINAVQAMPEGGKIKVYAENINIVDGDSLSLQEGRHVKIIVEDQGTGISQKHLQNIFDPYFTTKQKGNGLGLATTYSIIKKHGGHITVESEVEVGTTFHIYLPASRKQNQEKSVLGETKETCSAPAEEEDKEKPIVSKGKILIMDDEYVIRVMLSKQLTGLGYEVETAEEGSEAVRLYKSAGESGKPFDAVVMDLTITGGMGGEEAVKRLLEIDPEVKAIVVSGYANDPIMVNYKEYGLKGVLAKPHEIHELDEALQKVIAEANQ